MIKTWKRRWMAALKSGQYLWEKRKLRNGQTQEFSCLGVLCDITELGTWNPDGTFQQADSVYTTRPGLIIRKLVGLDRKTVDLLLKLNEKGWTLPQIAGWLDLYT